MDAEGVPGKREGHLVLCRADFIDGGGEEFAQFCAAYAARLFLFVHVFV